VGLKLRKLNLQLLRLLQQWMLQLLLLQRKHLLLLLQW
jgi:hypothetical protein